uniref:Uncharacterized protein n=1 Tax=Aegilops tauschii subsp. strangulata TaxID=200361 RepID=A0A452Z9F8_AEGTS
MNELEPTSAWTPAIDLTRSPCTSSPGEGCREDDDGAHESGDRAHAGNNGTGNPSSGLSTPLVPRLRVCLVLRIRSVKGGRDASWLSLTGEACLRA